MSNIKVLVVEDDIIIANDIKGILRMEGYSAVKLVYNYKQAVKAIDEMEFDIILLDINLSDKYSGLDVANYAMSKVEIPIVYITSYSTKDILEEAKKTRPCGYIVKPFDEKTLISTIEISVFNHKHALKNVQPLSSIAKINSKLNRQISDREYEVLVQIYDGYSNERIASNLFISLSTVKTHIINLFSKFDVNSRTLLLAKLRTLTDNKP